MWREGVRKLHEEAWIEFLAKLRDEQGLDPSDIVSDAGTALVPASRQVFDRATQHRDIFHARSKPMALLSFLERQAYKALKRYYKVEGRWQKAGPDVRRSAGQKLWSAEDSPALLLHDTDQEEAAPFDVVGLLQAA